MANRIHTVVLSDDERIELRWREALSGYQERMAIRARIILLAAESLPGVEIARRAGCSEQTVVRWRKRFTANGLPGLEDRFDGRISGIPSDETRRRILTASLDSPPSSAGSAKWSSRLLADFLSSQGISISHDTVARVWRRAGLIPSDEGTHAFSTQPVLRLRRCELVGVYLRPPLRAGVIWSPADEPKIPVPQAGTCAHSSCRCLPGTLMARLAKTGYLAHELHVVLAADQSDEAAMTARRSTSSFQLHMVSPPTSWIGLMEVFCLLSPLSDLRGRHLIRRMSTYLNEWCPGRSPFMWTRP
jgi:transposase